jgi:hypothetical protein
MMLGRSTCRAALVALVGLLAVGCSTEESLPQLDVDPQQSADETRAGTLLAEYAHPRSNRSGGLSVHAQFLDVQGVNYETALEALEVWSPDWQLQVDGCSLRSDAPVAQSSADEIRLELLDVGPISVRGPQEAITLEARRLPDLLSAFAGVIYGTEQGLEDPALHIDFRPGALYGFDAPGHADSGGFGVSLRAPEPIQISAVGGQPLGQASYAAWDFDHDLPLQWDPDFGGDDELFLLVSSGFGPDRPRLSCRLEDDGSFVLPAPLLEQMAGDADDLELSLRRVNARAVDIDGLESSEFIFSTVDEITLVDD